MKLKTKIQLFSSLFMIVMMLIINTSIYFLFYQNATNSQLDQLTAQTDVLIERLSETTSEAEYSELIHAYLPANGMGKVFSRENRHLEYVYRPGAYTMLEVGEFQTEENHEIIQPERGVYVAVVTKPVIWHDGSVVTLQLSDNLVELSDTMTILFYVLIIASLIILIPTIIGSTILSRFLLNPIYQLTQTMRENIQGRKWKKIEHTGRSKDELYDMEVTFNEMMDQLKENYERQEDFVSNASHELKTPIQIVKSYAQLMERRGEGKQELIQESIEAIDSEADRMKKLVEQLLSLAKNKKDTAYKEVDFVQTVEETVTTFMHAYTREIEFVKNAERVKVFGNLDQLEQIIYILIDNAFKYSTGKVVVSLFTFNGEVIFSVKDFGQGISKKDQERIFERFYRVDKARSRESGGTGLGLSIAKELADEHRGRLTIESELNEGTTFSLVLPRVQ